LAQNQKKLVFSIPHDILGPHTISATAEFEQSWLDQMAFTRFWLTNLYL
jgi:hypothetical protein